MAMPSGLKDAYCYQNQIGNQTSFVFLFFKAFCLPASFDTDELTYATQMQLRKSAKKDALKIVIDSISPRRARTYTEAMKKCSFEEEQDQSNKLTNLRVQ